MNKIKDEKVKEVVNNYGYLLLEDYFVNSKRRIVIEDYEGYKYNVSFSDFKNNNSFWIACPSNPFSIHNISLWLSKNSPNLKLIKNNRYAGSKKGLRLFCSICKDYPIMGWDTLRQGGGCGVCHGDQTGRFHSIYFTHPKISKEWDYKRNYPLTPKDVTWGSDKPAWWICKKCDYNWNTKNLKQRTFMNTGCPNCAGQTVNDKNRFTIAYPNIAKEWNFEKNDKNNPEDFSYGTPKKFWWKCSVCSHEWKCSIVHRTKGKTGCPECARKQRESRIARGLKEYCEKYFNSISEYKKLKNPETGRYLPYDIFIPKYKIFIEIQGKQHYSFIGFYGKTFEDLKYSKKKDRMKKKYAKQNGVYIEVDLRKVNTLEKAISKINEVINSL